MTKSDERKAWAGGEGFDLAQAVCPDALAGTTARQVPSNFCWAGDDDRLVAVGRSGERQRDLDLALAYGLDEAVDRELVLVLPTGTAEPTRRRLPWIDPPVRVFEFEGDGAPQPIPPLAQVEVLDGYDDPIVTSSHDLGERAAWVARLRDWADAVPELVDAHRSSYQAWHCRGRMVLAIRRSRSGLRITAGVHSTKDEAPPHAELIGEELSPAAHHRLIAAASAAIAARLAGGDTGNAEHLLQERLAERPWRRQLGLYSMKREFPAFRPVDNRGYIDFLAAGVDGMLHVVETKIGPDPMLVLQGLDYWIWAMAHRSELVGYFNDCHDAGMDAEPKVAIDFVVGDKGDQRYHPVTASQATALAGAISWRFHEVADWGNDATTVKSLPKRTPPS